MPQLVVCIDHDVRYVDVGCACTCRAVSRSRSRSRSRGRKKRSSSPAQSRTRSVQWQWNCSRLKTVLEKNRMRERHKSVVCSIVRRKQPSFFFLTFAWSSPKGPSLHVFFLFCRKESVKSEKSDGPSTSRQMSGLRFCPLSSKCCQQREISLLFQFAA